VVASALVGHQCDGTAMALACLYATSLLGWRENSPRRDTELIAQWCATTWATK